MTIHRAEHAVTRQVLLTSRKKEVLCVRSVPGFPYTSFYTGGITICTRLPDEEDEAHRWQRDSHCQCCHAHTVARDLTSCAQLARRERERVLLALAKQTDDKAMLFRIPADDYPLMSIGTCVPRANHPCVRQLQIKQVYPARWITLWASRRRPT